MNVFKQEANPPVGILLINLGTPENTTKQAIRRYLAEFLMDANVITLPWLWRWLLVNILILPLRISKVQHAYQKICMANQQLPLRYYTNTLSTKLQEQLGARYKVAVGMRYGVPNLGAALSSLQQANCQRIHCIPLFPQYARATTGSVIEYLKQPQENIISEFATHPAYIRALSNSIRPYLQQALGADFQFLLFSYHGLPLKQSIWQGNNYAASCVATTTLVAQQLGLHSQQYASSFQSRLGFLPWLQPYTDEYIRYLATKIEHLHVVSPAFMVDCLETLEELQMQLRDSWQQLGGKSFTFIPCLNDSDEAIQFLTTLIMERG
jgi:ferrochelatase